jgi:glyoxylase-like metal-dependent hydrolase (beta-lactamase superfamily II)
MIRETFPVGPLQCNCTILGDEATHEAIVVDPGDDIPGILVRLARHNLRVTRIVVTHAHIDHIAGAQSLKAITAAPILYNQHDLPLAALIAEQADWLGVTTPDVRPPDDDLPDHTVIHAGSIHAEVLHTPGHTPGSICLHIPDHALLLAGDTLFAGAVGRTDLFIGGDHEQLLRSIHGLLLPLPDNTMVIPGHGGVTTIGRERQNNPFLQDI